MCVSRKKGQPSMVCLIPLSLLCMIMAGGLIGTWVSCYYKCLTGRVIEFNYYVAVWTGGLAFISGLLQMFLGCCWNKPLKIFLVMMNVIVLLCCLACAALTGYNTYREAILYDVLLDKTTTPSLGTILTGLEAVLALFILFLIIIWNCVIGCSSFDDADSVYNKPSIVQQRQKRGVRGPYDEQFFNREPIGLYQGQHQVQEHPREVMYGSSSNRGKGANYVIPRASVSAQGNSNGYHGNDRAMVVDGGESYRGNDNPQGFYSGSSRYRNQNGSPYQNESDTFRVSDLGSQPGNLTNKRYGQSINLMQMHGVAPTNNITQGYY